MNILPDSMHSDKTLSQMLKMGQSILMGITKFSDLTRQEFARTYLNLNFNSMALLNLKPITVKISNEAPEAFDWRRQGVVSDIKDQGSCGSCWAFVQLLI